MPKIAILMAVYNGMPWIKGQLESILKQDAVSVRVFIADDCSDDSTSQWLAAQQVALENVTLLPQTNRRGSAGKNFYRLISDVDTSQFDYIAFADQDDIWAVDKLSRHVEIAKKFDADGVSSNVMAFWADGREHLIDKAQPQKQYDFLFESAGPGCTFLMTPWLVNKVKEQLLAQGGVASEVCLHDWLAYAICRAHGRKWVIDAVPSVYYRQHGSNVLGANSGVKAKLARFLKLKQGWYRAEVQKICQVCMAISEDHQIKSIHKLLLTNTLKSRFKLMVYVMQARRKLTDRMVLMVLVLFCLF